MDSQDSVFEHQLAHSAWHAGRVRIVRREIVPQAIDHLEVLFPHELVLTAPMGCDHVCVYTSAASARLIADRIREHLVEVEHRPAA